ncbi:hypothetical protein ES706_06598 [subsurface metagenome]
MSLDIVALPSPNHIGVVVKDVDKTIKFLSSMCGLGPWTTFDYTAHKEDMIVGEPFALKITFTKLGPTVLELLEPVEGRSVWAQFIETNGEGIHHIAFSVSNWDEMVSKLQERGGKMLVCALSSEGKRWCYFDTKPGGIVLELMDNFGL